MVYRDENTSLRARISELEGELVRRDDEIARLKGGVPSAEPLDRTHSKVLNAPLAFVRDRTLDHTVDVHGLEAIADVLRERLRVDVTQVGRTLRAKQGTVSFELNMVDGRTRIRLEATFVDRRNGLFIGGPTSGFFASLLGAGVLASIAMAPVVVAGGLALLATVAAL